MKKWYEDLDFSTATKTHSTAAENNVAGETRSVCSWCGHVGFPGNGVQGHVQNKSKLSLFCSEVCFSQCRRAAFKQTRMCDWCKHGGNNLTVADFYEGDRQLQFCGQKCLNQYKMHLFCKETTSLGIAPQTSDASSKPTVVSLGKEVLITPESWLGGNCAADSSQTTAENDSESLLSTDNEVETPTRYHSPNSPLDLVNYSTKSRSSKRVKTIESTTASPSKRGKSDPANGGKIKNSPKVVTSTSSLASVSRTTSSTDTTTVSNHVASETILAASNYWQQNLVPFPFRHPFIDPSLLLPQWTGFNGSFIRPPIVDTAPERREILNRVSIPTVPQQLNSSPIRTECKTGDKISRAEESLDKKTEGSKIAQQEKSSHANTNLFPPSYVLSPYPVLIPLPVPVPIIVPSALLNSLKQSKETEVKLDE